MALLETDLPPHALLAALFEIEAQFDRRRDYRNAPRTLRITSYNVCYTKLLRGLLPSDRGTLHQRIAARFDAMLAAGFEDEVSALRSKYTLSLDLPSMRCVGYRQVWEAQDGIIPREEMRDRGIYATRQLAKRQITWMANTLKPEPYDCLDPASNDRIGKRIAAFLAEN